MVLKFARALAAAALLGLAAAAPAVAETAGNPRDRTLYVSAYASQWVDPNLLQMPGRLLTADLEPRHAYFLGGGLGFVLVPRFEVPLPFCRGCALRGNSVELEGVVLKHFDLQDHWEVAGGAFARTGQIPLFLGAALNLAAGGGLSYAFSDPNLEAGRSGVRGVDTYRLQFYLAFETELAHAAVPGWNLVGRLHHRSGAYGVLSEKGSGSNFVGLGLRRNF
ncbi:MAG: hypothetical protein ICV73_00490 [Acetobacteraceae bacterium]|nr:hypothetical protein [Acetobacteraceae bacterium]